MEKLRGVTVLNFRARMSPKLTGTAKTRINISLSFGVGFSISVR